MINKSLVDQYSRALFDRLPLWLYGVFCLYTLWKIMTSFGGWVDVNPGTVFVTHWVMGFDLIFVLAYVYSLYCVFFKYYWTWREAQTFIDRVYSIAKKGPSTAGIVGDDLGEPDRNGVYTRKCRNGSLLFFRLARGSMSFDSESKLWQWSTDRRNWSPTAKVDQCWNDNDSTPGEADKILIKRLEVESAFREKQPFLTLSVHPPAIGLALNDREEKRLRENVPQEFLCPISYEIMTQPVVSPSGITYDRKSIAGWLDVHSSDPATNAPLKMDYLYPNLVMRDMIQEWLVDHNFIGTDK